MRRPVKPFVTEYKGPNRRPAHPAGSTPRVSPEDYSFLQAPTDAFSRHGAEHSARSSEESYEAALRAADALFSPAAGREADPSSGLLGAETGDGASESADTDAARADAARSGGRILRVIDEPPAADLSDLEAERAPKRRGRKPGSKNRPKSTGGSLEASLGGPVSAAQAARFVVADGVGRPVPADWSGFGLDPDRSGAGTSAKGQSASRHPQAGTGKTPSYTKGPPDRGLQRADRRDAAEAEDADREDADREDLDDEILDSDVAGSDSGQSWGADAPARPRAAFEAGKSVGVTQRPAESRSRDTRDGSLEKPNGNLETRNGNLETRNEERFAWVRTKLAPGERWKRRLPKVCW